MPSLMKARSGVLNSNIGGNALAPLFSTGALTIANAITDVTRLAGVEGDGEAYPDSSVGVWPAATNYCEYGNSAGTGWAAIGAGGLTPSTVTDWGQFGGQSIRFGGDGTINQGAHYYTPAGVATLGETWVVSCWIYSEVSRDYKVSCSERDAANGYLTESSVTVAVTAGIPLYFQCSRTFNNASVSRASIRVTADGTVGSAWEARVSGVNIEKSSIATPYIETDGGTASRVAGSIIWASPGALFNATQGAAVFRVRAGFAYATAGTRRIFSIGTSPELLDLYHQGSTGWVVRDMAGGTASYNVKSDAGLVVGDVRTLIAGWSASKLYFSVDGSAWDSGIPRTGGVSSPSGDMYIGLNSGGAQFYGDILSASFFVGPHTALNPATINSWGNNDPLPHMLPRAATPSFLAPFNGDGTAYRYSA